MIALLTVLVLVRMYRMSPCDLGTGTSRYGWLVLCVVKEWLAVSRSEHLLWSKECGGWITGRSVAHAVLGRLRASRRSRPQAVEAAMSSDEVEPQRELAENGTGEDDQGPSERATHLMQDTFDTLDPRLCRAAMLKSEWSLVLDSLFCVNQPDVLGLRGLHETRGKLAGSYSSQGDWLFENNQLLQPFPGNQGIPNS